MAARVRRPAVRFTLNPLQKHNDYTKENHDMGRDSGAPSPDNAPFFQPANVRLAQNQQRIKLLNSINEILHERAEYESSRNTLATLHDELKRKLKRKIEECFAAKKLNLMEAKASTKSLEREKELLIVQIEKLNSHLLQHSHEHEKHSQNENESENVKLYTISTVSKTPDKKPSRKADQKLAAGRLLREVQQLRSRLTALERKLVAETRRKKQAEEELSILKAALSRQKGKRVDILKPLSARN
ncbi:uncharacterized protein LOC143913563 [Arctopsyche grandis]|uniref:uncharacterized protein LOC143913563 n=1 Tax=Arctopsyche grandis TaxID=121162 RepID=UPI00406D7762